VDSPGLVVNSSGGLVGRGHPLGATGLAQVIELATQLRGRAGDRQVAEPRLGVAINTGGIIYGDAGFVGIHGVRAGTDA
jgi:acetyl-CoA acetyltransferase